MSNRIWILATAIICIAIVALGVVVGVSPNLASSAKSELEKLAVDGQNSIYEADLAKLKKQFESIDDVRKELAKLQESLPADAASAEFLQVIANSAALAGVTLEDFAQETPVVYGSFDSGDGGGTEESASISGGTLLGIPVSQSVTSTNAMQLLAFVSLLQQGTRLFVVTDLVLTSELDGGSSIFTLKITGYIYTLADPDAQTDAVPTDEPTEEPTPEPTETPATEETPGATPTPSGTPVT